MELMESVEWFESVCKPSKIEESARTQQLPKNVNFPLLISRSSVRSRDGSPLLAGEEQGSARSIFLNPPDCYSYSGGIHLSTLNRAWASSAILNRVHAVALGRDGILIGGTGR